MATTVPASPETILPTTSSETTSTTASARIEVTTTIPSDVMGPGRFDFENVPRPLVNGGYSYSGYGHFQFVDASDPEQIEDPAKRGPSFFWRDGHFVWADGSLMEVDERLKQIFREKGVLTDKGLPYGERQSSIADIPDWAGIPDLSGLTTEQALNCAVRGLSGLGWWVRHTYIDSLEPLAVTFSVDDSDNGPFIEDILLRDFLYARTHGLKVDKLGIEYESRPDEGHGDLTPAEGMAQVAAKLWLTPPPGVNNKALQTTVAARLPGEGDRPGCTVKSLEVTTSYLESRRVTLAIVAAGNQSARDQAEGYAADVLALIQALNADEGAGIAVLRFDAFDASGAPLMQERWDLDLGRHSSA